ncbi:MAG TPA: 3-hydroxyacyl-CoA dehydrogenase NAD-binding domain-containing protein, partial [Thermoanaerobaculia bacterium]
QIGLPEVRLGIFPAWGGCTRLPRVVGLAAALDLILTGKSLDARRARRVGLVDEAVPAAIFEDWSRRFVRSKLGTRKPGRRRKPRSIADYALEGTPLGRKLIFAKARERVMKQTGGHYPAPLEALEVIEEGFGKPVEQGLAAEARHIGLIFGDEVQRNLLALFFLTEEVKKETGVDDPSVRTRPVTRIGVLGAGVMGGGIAQLAADKGLSARMKDIQPAALAHGYAAAAAVWREALQRGRLSTREMARKMDLLSGTLDYSGFSRCEVTIEAVVEKLAVKRAVLKEWEEAVPRSAIFASNTSTLPITEIAVGSIEPGRVAGMHFFNPVHRMPLVEVIRGERTSDETVATIFALAKTLGKTPVVVRDAPGFLVNRILAPYLSEAVRLVLEGCRIEDVDAAMTQFGMPVGPLALLDDVGLDVAAKAGEVLEAAFPERMKMGGEEALAAAGRLGRKNGKGFYEYENGKRGAPAKEAYEALRVERTKESPIPRGVIEARLVLPMVNEAAFCLEDRIVTDPAKLDLAMIFGTGFPPFRGGLLRYADSLGLDRVFTRLDDLAERLGPRFAPAARIQELANARAGFYSSSPRVVSEQAS